jgi:hypothetical protein
MKACLFISRFPYYNPLRGEYKCDSSVLCPDSEDVFGAYLNLTRFVSFSLSKIPSKISNRFINSENFINGNKVYMPTLIETISLVIHLRALK